LLDQNIKLVEGHVDMAVRIGKLPDSAMISTTVGSMRTVISASPELLAVHGVPQTAAELQKMPCITFDGPGPLSGWRLTDPKTKTPLMVPVASRLIVTTAEAAVRAALLHVGVTRLLHYQVADALATGGLEIVLERFEPAPAPVSLVHAGRGQMPLKMRRFIDFAVPRLKRILLEIADANEEP
jgi:DNA-binding transcriptional LysR family regulator